MALAEGPSQQGETALQALAETMKKAKIPQTDSLQELAAFWDSHDLTDFQDELEEVIEPVFVRGTPISVRLPAKEGKAVQQLARAKGVTKEELIRQWVVQKVARRENSRATPSRQRKRRSGRG